jgi:hypothetical protein
MADVPGVRPEIELAWRRAQMFVLDPGMEVRESVLSDIDRRSRLIVAAERVLDRMAIQRIGHQIQAGTVWLNEMHQYTPHQVFGGHKQSGIGAENSLHGLGEYTNWQTVTLNKDPDAV